MSPARLVSAIARFCYGFFFLILLPALLWFWARQTERFVPLPAIASLPWGVALAAAGLLAMAAGMAALMMYGRGLPMNAFPPREFVQRGIYRLLAHPIYVGFTAFCAGVAIAAGSASGLWLVSPMVALGCTALVAGWERHDLAQRFGADRPRPALSLPPDEARQPHPAERAAVYALVLLPWLALYEAVRALGIPAGAITLYLPFERHLPVMEWTEVFYGATYLFVFLAPLAAASARSLKEFSVAGLLATGAGTLMFLIIPVTAPPRDFIPRGFPGQLLQWERALDTPAAAFPSFHVIWAILAARVWADAFPAWKMLWWGCAGLISLGCVTTGTHAIADVAAGGLIAWMAIRSPGVWEWLRRRTERVANSWREWNFGPVRIINHGAWAGAGTFLGLWLIGTLLGPAATVPILAVALCSLVTAGLWAQFIEGSPSLLRPYGYYGGVFGVVIGIGLIRLAGEPLWLPLAGFAVAGPLVQALGRMRCLVQGCCHGREAPAAAGIRYTHPRSRVCRLSEFAGIPIHPTPLYSILWNVVTGSLLLRLWFLQSSPSLIAGLYLILNGLGRFVEESYRGEPQTPVFGRLRMYQILAVLSVFAGMALTMIDPGTSIPPARFSWGALAVAAGFGLFTWFALGVDFPRSNRRFSRLV